MISAGLVLLVLGLFLFFAGILQCLSSRRFLGYLIGIEMMLNAANLNLAGFLSMQPQRTELQSYIMMVCALAAMEAVIGLSVFVWISFREEEPEFSLL